MAMIGNIVARVGADIRPLQQQMTNAQRIMQQFGRTAGTSTSGINSRMIAMGNIAANVFMKMAAKISEFSTDSIKSYNDVISSNMGLQSILEAQGKSFSQAQTFINGYIQDGLVPLQDATTAYKNLVSRGYDDKQIGNLMNRLKDAAAFGRQSGLSIGDAVRGAAEGLKNENSMLVDNAGITKNVAKMWEEYAATIGTTRDKLTLAQKRLAEYNGTMEESKFQTGDAAKYADTLAGQMAALDAKMIALSASLGSVFAPMLQTIIPYLSTFVSWLTAAFTAVGQFMSVLFGTAKTSTDTAKTAAKAQSTLGKETEKAGKKAKKSVAGFDEINQLQEDTAKNAEDAAAAMDTSSNVGGAGAPSGGDIIPPDVIAKAQAMRDAIINAWDTITTTIQNNKALIVSACVGIGVAFAGLAIALSIPVIVGAFETLYLIGLYALDAVAGAIAFLLTPTALIIGAIALLTAGFVYLYQTNEPFRNFINGIWQGIKDFFVYLWNNVLKPLGEFIGKVFVAAWEDLKTAMNWMWKNVFVPIGEFFLYLWKVLFVPIGKVIGEYLAISFETLGKVAKSFWENVMIPLGNFFKDIFNPILDTLKIVLEFLWNNVFVPLGTFLSTIFMPIFDALGKAITTVWDKVLKPLTVFMNDVFFIAFDTVFKTIKELIEDFKKVFFGVLTFIQGVFTGDWKKAWQGVSDVFSGIMNGLENIFKTPLKAIISLLNMFIDKINSIKVTIPSVDIPGVGKVGGGTIGFAIPNIPQLAKGGITTGPTLAQIGEAGTEAVIPLENGGFVDTLASAIGTAIVGALQFNNNKSSGNNEVVINIDSTKLARVMIPAFEKENSRTGNRAIIQTV